MSDEQQQPQKTPVWLWLIFGLAIAVLLVGGLISRVQHMLVGVPLYAVGLALLLLFVVLRGRITGKK